jgi:hypothetical protein
MHFPDLELPSARGGLRTSALQILLLGTLSCFFITTPAHAFCEDNWGENWSSRCHVGITDGGLHFLRATIKNAIRHHINDPDHETGLAYASDDHFDSCNFDGATDRINERYLKDRILSFSYQQKKPVGVVNAFDPSLDISAFDRGPLLFKALSRWADVLHAAQDFYAHSNWIEMGFVHPETQLFDVGTTAWREFSGSWEVVKDDILTLQGETPSNWKIAENSTAQVPRVVTPDGKVHRLLISGKTTFSAQSCPSVNHILLGMHHDHLNKDHDGRPNHKEAAAMAEGQTRHEWCRLLRLTFDKGGSPAVAVPLILFPNSENGVGVGPNRPHPPHSICGAITRGPVPVRVSVNNIQVYQAAEEGESQLFNFVLGAFTQDVRLSQRSESVRITVGKNGVVPTSKLPPSIQFCIHKNHRLLVTLQGWREVVGIGGELEDGDAILWGATRSIGSQGSDISPHLGQTWIARSDNPRHRDLQVTFEVSPGTVHCEEVDTTTPIE